MLLSISSHDSLILMKATNTEMTKALEVSKVAQFQYKTVIAFSTDNKPRSVQLAQEDRIESEDGVCQLNNSGNTVDYKHNKMNYFPRLSRNK